MIKANELRRGNLVDYTGSFLPIDSIAGDETVRLLVNGSSIGCFYTHLIDPIPLKPEVLEKAGLQKDYDDYFKINDSFLISKDGYVYFETPDNIPHIITLINTVRQLQNLYFALTGEELEIKL